MRLSSSPQTRILWSTLAWVVGLGIIFIIWTILSTTVYHDNQLPSIPKCFIAFGNELVKSYSWLAILIAWAQTMGCFMGSFIIALGLVLIARMYKWVAYLLSPFITLFRALPTAILMVLIAVFLITVLPLVPIVVAFFIIFPMLYEGMNVAINNVDKKNIEMATVFNVTKKDQIKYIYIPAILPYIFSAFVAAFGLTFKITIASQMVNQIVVGGNGDPGYPSIGMIIWNNKGQYDIIIAWGMIAILISLIMELIIKEIGRISMPFKYNDRKHIAHFFSKIWRHRG